MARWNDVDFAKLKILRGEIIGLLYSVFGSKVTAGSLRNSLRRDDYVSDGDIRKALIYLSDANKRFVRMYIHDGEDMWDGFVELTGDGVNLAEGDKTDEGVVISV